MPIQDDTLAYEAWLRTKCDVHEPALKLKHKQMNARYPFFRATYYRWAKLWRRFGGELLDAPPVLAIGDIHLENYGTWRDADCRLCWGVNDFDEAEELPWTHDLVRLAASTQFASKAEVEWLSLGDACRTILAGYRKCLRDGGEPFVLEEHHYHLRKLAVRKKEQPPEFWEELHDETKPPREELPDDAKTALLHVVPKGATKVEFRTRMKAGVGSLGKPRFVAIVDWHGGQVCREAKAITPPATGWLGGRERASHLKEAVENAVRSRDPFYQPVGKWITRRLAPHCSKLKVTQMKDVDAVRTLAAMGAEIANVHLGTAVAVAEIKADLKHRPRNWLESAAAAMAEAVARDWRRWCNNPLM
jgi:hypothetical protein